MIPGLSEAQQRAVQSAESALIVKAAAGSGKTRVLVARFLKHVVEDGFAPEQILTMTFTRKAAAQMKRRIVDHLREFGREEDAQSAETGPIQTIHGFCERLLREQAVSAGVDPDFQILDEAAAKQWMEMALKQAIAETNRFAPHAEALIEKLAGVRQFGDASVHGQLEDAVRRVVGALRGTLHRPESLRITHSDPASLVETCHRALVAELSPPVRAEFESRSAGEPFWLRYRKAHQAAKEPVPSFCPGPSACEALAGTEADSARASCGLVDLATRTWAALEDKMLSEQAFDFSLLERLAVDLAELPEISETIRRQYRVLLVDEAQDLNPIQYQLIASLGIATEMSVGDSQQSIYGFRQADVRLFEQRAREIATIDLARNYRSVQAVLHTVDRMFGDLWDGYLAMADPDEDEPDFAAVELWDMPGKDMKQAAEWIAELCEGEDPGDVAVLVRSGSTIDSLHPKLEALGLPVRTAGAGDRFYARLEVRDLANLLAALADPSDDFALLAALRSPAAGLSLDALVLLAAEPGVATRLRDFVSPVESDSAKLEAFADWFLAASVDADRLPAWEALALIMARTPFLANLARKPNSRQLLANVRKLQVLAAGKPEMNADEFARYLRQVRELKHREGDAPAVGEEERAITLMTIHKSKGLEFPVVVLPDTHGKIGRAAGNLEIDKDLGLAAFKCDDRPFPIRDWIARKRKDAEMAEELRTLYVAMTRAERKLCIVVCDDDARLGGRIKTVLAREPAPPFRWRAPKPEPADPV